MIKAVQSFQKNIDRIVIDKCKPHKEAIMKLNFEGQIALGKTYLGTEITPPYRFTTIAIKTEKHQITDHVTLYDEGNFYYGRNIIFKATQFDITSKDKKTKALTEKYDDIFGLTIENLSEVSAMIKPDIQDEFRKQVLNKN